jgi:hypothetical protein
MKPKYLAQVIGGMVEQVIVAPSVGWAKEAKLPGEWVDVTALAPRPCEGWTYDGESFAPPADE